MDWIVHEGSDECPVPDGTRIEVRFRADLLPWITNMMSRPENLRWTHKGGSGDIIAYRIAE